VLELRKLLSGYNFGSFDYPGAYGTGASGINDSGQIVGDYATSFRIGGSFLKDSGGYTAIEFPGAYTTEASGINDSGQIVGSYSVSSSAPYLTHGFLKDSAGYTAIDFPGAYATQATGINDSGDIVGDYFNGPNGMAQGFLKDSAGYTTLDVPGATSAYASGINDSGQIVGTYVSSSQLPYYKRGFLWDRGAYTTLDFPGIDRPYAFEQTSASGINDSGQIVGYYATNDGSGFHGFLYNSGVYTTIDYPGSDSSFLVGISDSGQIVRSYAVDNSHVHDHAFLATTGPIPTKVQADPAHPGGLVVTYELFQQLPPGEEVPISVYWATGSQASEALSVNPPHGQAKGFGDALYTYWVDSSEGAGTHPFNVSPNELLTAPNSATNLLVVADPTSTFSGQGYPSAILAVPANLGDLSASQVDKLLPGGGQFAVTLSQTMSTFGIDSLEQRAMFMGQLAVESDNLTHWIEDRSNSSCIYLYWANRFNAWAGNGTGASATPISSGIVVSLPVSGKRPPATKGFVLEWALGSATAPVSSTSKAAATAFASVHFGRVGKRYAYTFNGAVPPDTGLQFPHLLVVDATTHKVVMDLVNTLGNWSPADAYEFRGGGPIQLTGRHNYQLFADYEGAAASDLMTTTGGNSPAQQLGDQNNPQLGFDAAGYSWKYLAGNLNARTNAFAWAPAASFNLAISKAINNPSGIPNALEERLQNYLRIRAALLDPDL
jgi:probable HAF family extracellular repeat protein